MTVVITGIIIDQAINQVNPKEAYLLTESAVYKTADLDAATPTWSEMLAYDDFSLDTVEFSRIVCRSNYVYVLGSKNGTVGVSGDAVLFYSHDNGITWSYSVIAENVLDIRSYTVSTLTGRVDSSEWVHKYVPYYWYWEVYKKSNPCEWKGAGATQNPWSIAWTFIPDVEESDWYMPANYDSTIINTVGILPLMTEIPRVYKQFWGQANVDLLTVPQQNMAWGFLDDYFGVGNWQKTAHWWDTNAFAKSVNRVCLEIWGTAADHPHAPSGGSLYAWIFWYGYSPVPGVALDAGRHTYTKVYVGSEDKIYRSVDGGVHWEEYISDLGANDIECHYAQDTVDDEITFWGSDGNLYRTNGGIVEGVFGGVADVSPIAVPLRVASDPIAGFPIWVLEHQGSESYKLKKSNDGVAWAEVATGLSRARSLRTYADVLTNSPRIVYMVDSNIYFSSNGTTFSAKVGDYPSYKRAAAINLW